MLLIATFKPGTVTESYDSAPGWIDASSANKQALEGTAVNLVISKGAKPAAADVKVPDLPTRVHQRLSLLCCCWPQSKKW